MAQGLKEFEAKCQKDSEDQIRSDAFAKSQERWMAETEARIRTKLEKKSLPLLPMCRCRLQTTLTLPLLPIYRCHLQTILTPLRRMPTTRPATISTNPLSPLSRKCERSFSGPQLPYHISLFTARAAASRSLSEGDGITRLNRQGDEDIDSYSSVKIPRYSYSDIFISLKNIKDQIEVVFLYT